MASESQAQPGSRETSSGGETSTPGGGSQVDVKQVLNTETTGQLPENVNKAPDDADAELNSAQPGSRDNSSGGETSTPGGGSQVDTKQVLNTETTGQPPSNANG